MIISFNKQVVIVFYNTSFGQRTFSEMETLARKLFVNVFACRKKYTEGK